MLKLRLKRIGRKRAPSYRLVVMENSCRRDGRPLVELGYYNPISKKSKTTYAKWCEKHDIPWCSFTTIPIDWLT